MIYLHDRNKDRKKKRFYIGLFIAIIVVILSAIGVFSKLGGFFQIISRPMWKMENGLGNATQNLGYLATTKSSVYNENLILKEKNRELETRMMEYSGLLAENAELKDMLGRIDPKDDFLLATILIKPNRSPYDTVIVDVGEDNNVLVGAEVFAKGDVPMGTISQVYAHTSVVKLFSTPGEVTQAQIEGSNASVELIGRGGGNFEMLVPVDLTVPEGTNVVLPFIKMRVVATVVDIISAPQDPLRKVILKSPVNIQQERWLQIKQ
jgi:cell shape-determining protein MreC